MSFSDISDHYCSLTINAVTINDLTYLRQLLWMHLENFVSANILCFWDD